MRVAMPPGSPNYGLGAKSGPRRHFVNNEKTISKIYKKFVDLAECNISSNNHIT